MKCAAHQGEAIGICTYCGKALCAQCDSDFAAPRLSCSTACGEALVKNERSLELILKKSVQSANASAFYCYLCGGLSLGASAAAWEWLPSPFLIWFTGACGVALLASGFWYGRIARRNKV